MVRMGLGEGETWQSSVFLLSNHGCEGSYNNSWRVDSGATAPYYLGIFKNDSIESKVGWLELAYNLENGEINVVQSHFTSDSTIVIE